MTCSVHGLATVGRSAAAGFIVFAFLAAGDGPARAQGRAGGAPPQAPPTAQASAPIDLTGNWVAVVTEDWRWRMLTPPKGDYASLPLNADGIKAADAWTPAMDGMCQAYGMGGLLRQPTRLRISWQDPQTLKIETDAGLQTRLLSFDANARKPVQRSLQGFTHAEWDRLGRGVGGFVGGNNQPVAPTPAPTVAGRGSLRAVTTMLSTGWLRKNGVAYSENAEITEYFNRYSLPNGDEWFGVTTILNDPRYFNNEVVVSSHFKKEPDGSKWDPSPCKTTVAAR